jgi:hypothetical protein
VVLAAAPRTVEDGIALRARAVAAMLAAAPSLASTPNLATDEDVEAGLRAAEALYDAEVFAGELLRLDKPPIHAPLMREDAQMMWQPENIRSCHGGRVSGRIMFKSASNCFKEFMSEAAAMDAILGASGLTALQMERARAAVAHVGVHSSFATYLCMILEHEMTHALLAKAHASDTYAQSMRRPPHGAEFFRLFYAWTGAPRFVAAATNIARAAVAIDDFRGTTNFAAVTTRANMIAGAAHLTYFGWQLQQVDNVPPDWLPAVLGVDSLEGITSRMQTELTEITQALAAGLDTLLMTARLT